MKAQITQIPKNYIKIFNKQSSNKYQSQDSQSSFTNHWDAIIQFGWNKQQDFKQIHIADAIYIDCIQVENPPEWLLKPQDQIKHILNKYLNKQKQKNEQQSQKVNSQCNILVYNRDFSQISIIPACRIALILLHLNICSQVDIISDGLEGYLNNNSINFSAIRITNSNNKIQQNQNNQYQSNNKIILSKQQVKQKIGNTQLVDIRTRSQYQGVSSGYSYCNKKGHIPCSIYHGGVLSKTCKQINQYSINDGQFINMWKSQGISLIDPIIIYCGTGWRASKVMVCAYLNNITNISLYSNGWIQWSMSQGINKIFNVASKQTQYDQEMSERTYKCCKN